MLFNWDCSCQRPGFASIKWDSETTNSVSMDNIADDYLLFTYITNLFDHNCTQHVCAIVLLFGGAISVLRYLASGRTFPGYDRNSFNFIRLRMTGSA